MCIRDRGTTEALDLYEDYTEKKVILGPWKHSGNADYDIHGFALASNALRYDIDLVCFQWCGWRSPTGY